MGPQLKVTHMLQLPSFAACTNGEMRLGNVYNEFYLIKVLTVRRDQCIHYLKLTDTPR